MDANKAQTMAKFSGVNNVLDATRMSPEIVNHEYVFPLQQATNVDIDDSFGLKSRVGYTSVKTGSDVHSMWSDNRVCLFMDTPTLYQLHTDYTVTALVGGLSKSRMSYAPINDRVYYTNSFQIGYVKDVAAHALVDPGKNFKLPLPAGHLIEVFNSCLLVAKDNVLYISDPLCDYYDTRYGYKIFKGRITMLISVDGGVYIADTVSYFMEGDSNEDFKLREIFPHGAVEGTAVKVNGKYIDDTLAGNVALWTSSIGICLGDNSGKISNITDGRYVIDAHQVGAGFVREKDNVRHYINSLY